MIQTFCKIKFYFCCKTGLGGIVRRDCNSGKEFYCKVLEAKLAQLSAKFILFLSWQLKQFFLSLPFYVHKKLKPVLVFNTHFPFFDVIINIVRENNIGVLKLRNSFWGASYIGLFFYPNIVFTLLCDNNSYRFSFSLNFCIGTFLYTGS